MNNSAQNTVITDVDADVVDDATVGAAAIDSGLKSSAAHSVCLLVAFVCMALTALNIWLVLVARAHEVQRVTTANQNLAGSIAQQVDNSLQEVEHVLQEVVFELEQRELEPKVLDRLQTSFVSRVSNVNQLHGLFVYDLEGRWLLTSEAGLHKSRSNADREYFKFHQNSSSREALLGMPIVSRSTGEWIIPLSRRLNDADGNFAGVAVATVKLNYFRQALERFKLGKDGATALALKGHILVRVPFNESDIGRNVSSQAIARMALHQRLGSSEERSVVDNVVRIISFDRALNYPVVAVVAVGQEEALQNWFNASVIQTLIFLALGILVMTGGWLQLRSVHRREAAEIRLRQARDALSTANEKLSRMAHEDRLTGLSNRRFFDMRLAKLFSQTQRNQQDLAVVMVDVDNFKKFNDLYGHVSGDECLQRVAEAVRSAAHRPEDVVARYGGEEFAMVLPQTDLNGARHIAEQARQAVFNLSITHKGSSFGIVTVTLGIAVHVPLKMDHPKALIQAADEALYRAKNAGRNRSLE